MMENHEFHNLLQHLGENPDDIAPHRRIICKTTDIIALLFLVVQQNHWHGLTDGLFPLILHNTIGPLKVMSDIWSDPLCSHLSYLPITLHLAMPRYLDVEYLELNSALAAFIPLIRHYRFPS